MTYEHSSLLVKALTNLIFLFAGIGVGTTASKIVSLVF